MKLSNKTLVFSGKFEGFTRTEIQNYAKTQGAKVASGLSIKVDYLVAGEKMGNSKRTKASKLGIPILSFEEFKEMIQTNDSVDFWTSNPRGDETAEDFLKIVESFNWSAFQLYKDGEQLRDLLIKQEEKNGVHAAHKYCSNQLRTALKLLHPYGHDDAINSSEVSPNGQWLATSNWLGGEYSRGGVLQIWEMKTGRIVNQIRVQGGIGWNMDVHAISWNHNSKDVALCYNTDHVGIWDPFGKSNEPAIYIDVTNSTEGPCFCWSGDGQSIFVHGIHDKDVNADGNEIEFEGYWIDTYQRRGNLSSYAVSGYLDDRKDLVSKAEPEDKTIDYPAPIISTDSVVFVHQQNDKGRGEFYNRPPGEDSPLIFNSIDHGLLVDIDPSFPINIAGKETWGLAFNEGCIMVPKDYPAAQFLNFSLGNKWAWSLDWVDIVRVSDLTELSKVKKALMPSFMPGLLRKMKPTKKRTTRKKKFPKSEGKTYDDIRELTITTLVDLVKAGTWTSHVPELLNEVALTSIIRGNPKKGLAVAKKIILNNRAVYAAELAVHSYKRGFKEADKFLALAQKTLPKLVEYQQYPANCYLAVCYYEKGEMDKLAEYEQAAIQTKDKLSQNQSIWYLLNMYLMSDQMDKALTSLKEYCELCDISSFDLPKIFDNISWYGTLDQLIALVRVIMDSKKIREQEFISYLSNKIVQDKAYNRLDEIAKIFTAPYEKELKETSAVAWAQFEEADQSLFKRFLSYFDIGSNNWLKYLDATALRWPDLLTDYLANRKWTLKEVEQWSYSPSHMYHNYFDLAKLIAKLNLVDRFLEEFNQELSNHCKICFAAGFAMTTKDEALREDYLTKIEAMLDSVEDGLGIETLWNLVALGSQHSPVHTDFLKRAIDIAILKDRNYALANLANILADNGVLLSAYTVWMKISKGSRSSRITNLLRAYCTAQDYNAIFDLLMSLEPTDLNNRGQISYITLNELTNNRGYRLS
ncbi:MAG: hypothetical protein MK212_06640 [Saprospiraceae bacterium]|nr:hypothetical protein [Saprospiraceae bacterium]